MRERVEMLTAGSDPNLNLTTSSPEPYTLTLTLTSTITITPILTLPYAFFLTRTRTQGLDVEMPSAKFMNADKLTQGISAGTPGRRALLHAPPPRART